MDCHTPSPRRLWWPRQRGLSVQISQPPAVVSTVLLDGLDSPKVSCLLTHGGHTRKNPGSEKETPVQGRQRRRFVRVSKRLEIEYTADTPWMAEIADLGEGGAFIVTPNPFPVGTRLRYKFHLPDAPIPIEGEAMVARIEPTVGMAIEFKGLSQEEHQRIRLLVALWACEPVPFS